LFLGAVSQPSLEKSEGLGTLSGWADQGCATRPTQNAPDPGDELPDGYVSIRETEKYKQALGAK
jgi:hypothetical protein